MAPPNMFQEAGADPVGYGKKDKASGRAGYLKHSQETKQAALSGKKYT